MRRPTRRGFSLIEALVALAIISMALLALYGLQLQLLQGESRAEGALAVAAMQRNMLAVVRDLNPMAQPTGAMTLAGGRRLSWSSTPASEPAPTRPDIAQPSRFVVRLYTVHAQVSDARGKVVAVEDIQRLGWAPAGP